MQFENRSAPRLEPTSIDDTATVPKEDVATSPILPLPECNIFVPGDDRVFARGADISRTENSFRVRVRLNAAIISENRNALATAADQSDVMNTSILSTTAKKLCNCRPRRFRLIRCGSAIADQTYR